MRVVSYNIHFGVGQDGVGDLGRVIDVVREADILALQEVDTHWDRSGNVDQVAEIAARLPDHDWIYGPAIDVAKWGRGGSAPMKRRRRRSGNMILSRFPILSARNHLLPKLGAKHKLDMQKAVLEAIVETPLGPLRVYGTHLCHLCDEQRLIQVERFLDLHARGPDEGPALSGDHMTDDSFSGEPPLPPVPRPAILLGDFNFLPDSAPYARLAGPFGPRWGRVTRSGGFVDAWLAAGHPDEMATGRTNPDGATSGDDVRRIDYCFVTDDLAAHIADAQVRQDVKASDHYPLFVTFRSPRDPAPAQT